MNEEKIINKKTLVPIGVAIGLLVGAVGIGSWVAKVDSAIDANKIDVAENKIKIDELVDDNVLLKDSIARLETKIDYLIVQVEK